MTLTEGVQNGTTILLLVQQNRIFKRTNELMLRQYEHDAQIRVESHPDHPRNGRTKRFISMYWPSILIGGFWGTPYLIEKTKSMIESLFESDGINPSQPAVIPVPSNSPPPSIFPTPFTAIAPYQYQNAMSIDDTFATAVRLSPIFSEFRTTIVITAPQDNASFKTDFEALIVAACTWNGNRSCTIEPAPADLTADLDSGVAASPTFSGIVVHHEPSADSVAAKNFLGPLGCFTLHTSDKIPEAIARLNVDQMHNFFWFELGSGSPWSGGTCGRLN